MLKKFIKTKCIGKRFLSVVLIAAVLITASVYSKPAQAEASGLLGLSTHIDPSLIGTYDNGYQYNFTFIWQPYMDNHGYYLAVQNISTGKWVIKTSVFNATYEHIYGLTPGVYDFYLSALDVNGNLIDTHYGYRLQVGYGTVTGLLMF